MTTEPSGITSQAPRTGVLPVNAGNAVMTGRGRPTRIGSSLLTSTAINVDVLGGIDVFGTIDVLGSAVALDSTFCRSRADVLCETK